MSEVTVLKEKKGTPTVIQWNGKKYQLQHETQIKRGGKKSWNKADTSTSNG